MNSNVGNFKIGTKPLAPEILLKIFLCLSSCHVTKMRGTCKEFLEVIDNNKSLWRILDWKQQEEESPIRALEFFDEKSGSTLKQVSIFQDKGDLNFGRLIKVLDQSKDSLNHLILKLYTDEFWYEVIELASNSPNLNSLVLWPSQYYWMSRFPRTRLTRTSRQYPFHASRPSNLQILWCNNLLKVLEGRLDVSSLVSFADFSWSTPLKAHSIISQFSSSLIHLLGALSDFSSEEDPTSLLSSLSCPSLSVLEGNYLAGFFPWLNAPKLRIVIASFVDDKLMSRLPVSVEELWLLSWHDPLSTGHYLRILPHVCPKLKILILGGYSVQKGFNSDDLLTVLRARKEKVEQGAEIEGIKMVLLEKLILPTYFFESNQLNHLREGIN